MIHPISDFLSDEEGMAMVEYAIAGALISAVAAGAFATLGNGVRGTAEAISDAMGFSGPTTGGGDPI